MPVNREECLLEISVNRKNIGGNSSGLVPAHIQTLDSMGILRLFFPDGANSEQDTNREGTGQEQGAKRWRPAYFFV
jgi:hypothetical protein